ncbi:response regulator [Actimicrobium antarcticum]|uniref:histidine kinase n=1 Tax=Actimicrobium antarcticum TaxID=1051899 RepID=A0ABP7TGF8_9BURK
MLNALRAAMGGARRFARHPNSEHEQGLVRIAIGVLICVFVLWHTPVAAISLRLALVIGFFLCLSSLILLSIAFHPQPVIARRGLAILNDAAGITCGILYAGELGVPLYLFYLWITFGNGFRFGNAYLYATLAASLTGFSLALLFVDYWQVHRALGAGLWVGMILVGLYFSTLVTRLTRALQQEEAANQAKRSFISSVSHELRTPLNAIIGMTDLLQSTHLDHGQKEMVSSLDNASQLMLALIEDVLDFAKIEAGKVVIEDIDFDLHQLVGGILDIFKYQVNARGLQLVTDIDPDTPGALRGDPHHLRQVLVNLMSNAIKFTEQGGIVLRIRLPASASASAPRDIDHVRLRFEVEDTGIGIGPAAQGRIFDSFVQADESTTRRYGGTGLGTTISRQLVGLMGGELGLRSTLGVGSTFWFELDVCRQQPTLTGAPVALTMSPPPPLPVTPFIPLRLLVADDNATNRTVIRQMLERAGHQCVLAEDGEQVLDQLEQDSFDAVILDMNMPNMNGLEAARAIRFMESPGSHLPLIMLSADVNAETRADCATAGIDHFLSKPIRIDALLQTLDGLILQYGKMRLPAMSQREALVRPLLIQPDAAAVVLNYATLAELDAIGQNPQFVSGLMTGFIVDARSLMAQVEQAREDNDIARLRDVLHALKGSAMSIGALALRSTCAALEDASDADLARDPSAVVALLQDAVTTLLAALDQYQCTRQQLLAKVH